MPKGQGAVQRTLTVDDAAKILGVSRNGAYAAAQRGELPTIRIGRRLLVPAAALDRLLDVALPKSEAA